MTVEPRRAPPPPAPPERGERRRSGWRELRRDYPRVLTALGVGVVLLLAFDGWLVYKWVAYNREIDRLRAGMTDVERRKTDVELASEENRLRVMLELVRRQANLDKELHISVAVDSGAMYLERAGALLREMPVELGPERWVGTPPDTVKIAAPRGARTVEKVMGAKDGWEIPRWVYTDRGLTPPDDRVIPGALGPSAIILSGGAVIYATPNSGPLSDSSYVLPGAIRARSQDLRAIAPNIAPGMSVYLY